MPAGRRNSQISGGENAKWLVLKYRTVRSAVICLVILFILGTGKVPGAAGKCKNASMGRRCGLLLDGVRSVLPESLVFLHFNVKMQ